jgi:hypothetical protein
VTELHFVLRYLSHLMSPLEELEVYPHATMVRKTHIPSPQGFIKE